MTSPTISTGIQRGLLLAALVLAQSACRAKPVAISPPPVAFGAEARVTYFDGKQRVRGTIFLVADAECRLRYDVLGPHGGLLEAFALTPEGYQIRRMVPEKSQGQGSILPDQMDRLIPFAPLHLDGCQWVDLLFGRFEAPEHAEREGESYAWTDGDRALRLRLKEGRLAEGSVSLRSNPKETSQFKVVRMHPAGVPEEFRFESSFGQRIEALVRIRDLDTNPTIDASTFLLF